MMQLTLPPKAIRDWAIKDLVSRESVPDDADELQADAGVRRQLQTLEAYAQHALRLYAKSVDLHPSQITDRDRTSAALSIAALATDMRRDMRDGTPVLTDVPLPRPTARQLATDENVLHLLKFQLLRLTAK